MVPGGIERERSDPLYLQKLITFQSNIHVKCGVWCMKHQACRSKDGKFKSLRGEFLQGSSTAGRCNKLVFPQAWLVVSSCQDETGVKVNQVKDLGGRSVEAAKAWLVVSSLQIQRWSVVSWGTLAGQQQRRQAGRSWKRRFVREPPTTPLNPPPHLHLLPYRVRREEGGLWPEKARALRWLFRDKSFSGPNLPSNSSLVSNCGFAHPTANSLLIINISTHGLKSSLLYRKFFQVPLIPNITSYLSHYILSHYLNYNLNKWLMEYHLIMLHSKHSILSVMSYRSLCKFFSKLNCTYTLTGFRMFDWNEFLNWNGFMDWAGVNSFFCSGRHTMCWSIAPSGTERPDSWGEELLWS